MPSPTLLAIVSLAAPVPQESAVPFDTPLVVTDDHLSAPFQRLFDYDGDGYLDAVGITGNDLKVWHNDGTGALNVVIDESIFTAVQTIEHVEVGDLNGDGWGDFVLGEKDGYRIHTSNGDGTFAVEVVEPPIDLIDLAIGDFEGDGIDDLAVMLGTWLNTGELHVEMSSGIYVAAPTTVVSATGLLALEADGDFTDDLLVIQENNAHIYRVDPLGFVAADSFSVPDAYTVSWTAGDIDGDLDCDIVAFSQPWGPAVFEYVLFERFSPSGFQEQAPAPGGPADALADVDGDGDLDGIRCEDTSWPAGGTWVSYESTFFISINDGGQDFTDAFEIPMLGADVLGDVGDLDNDGDNDLVAGRCIYYAREPITSSPMPEMVFNPFTFRDHLIGDADRDGDPDPFVPYGPWNQGDGTLADLPQPEWPDAPPGQVITGPNWFGDFNGDGAWDAVYSRFDNSNPPWVFLQQELVLNTGGGGFVLGGPAAPPGLEWDVYENSVDNGFAADGDDDGDVDLFLRVNGFGGSITTSFHQNDGTGYFQSVWSLLKTRGELVADFNNDGHSDVFGTGSNESPTFRVFVGLPGAGAPYFDGPIEIPSSATPKEERQYTACDYNDDGWMDISFVDWDGKPYVWFNTTGTPGAPPTFSSTTDFFGSQYETDDDDRPRVVGLDANGDGLTDIVVGPFPYQGNAAYVFLRKPGTSGVLTLADYETPFLQILTGLYPSDIDGDGDTDLFGAAIAYNATFDPAYGGGSRVQSEAPGPGTDGMIPILGAHGPFRAGETTKLTLSGAVGGTLSVLIFSQQSAFLPDFPLPGANTYVDPFSPGFAQIQIPVIGPAGVGGAGYWDPNTPGFLVPAGIAGLTFHHQAFVIDTGAPSVAVHSNRLSITYGL